MNSVVRAPCPEPTCCHHFPSTSVGSLGPLFPTLVPCRCRQCPNHFWTKPSPWTDRHEGGSHAAAGSCVGGSPLCCCNCRIARPCNVSASRQHKCTTNLLLIVKSRNTLAVGLGALCPPTSSPWCPPPLTHHTHCRPCLAVLGLHHPLQEHEGVWIQPQDGVSQPATLPPLREGELPVRGGSWLPVASCAAELACCQATHCTPPPQCVRLYEEV
jgi:hypothetical protein